AYDDDLRLVFSFSGNKNTIQIPIESAVNAVENNEAECSFKLCSAPPKCLANRRGIFYALTSPNGDKSTKKKCATPNIELTFDYGSIITPFGDICQ
ncbi:MAG: hypothetical protein SOR90_07605, partial [Oscillospiraceae bacterium]|nr:hypothetical protein [Oscillospiraceae bacterium]